MTADFEGYVTKANVKCTDGRTIDPAAFAHQDKKKVPLVWHHVHDDPERVLGHVILEHRDSGMYGQAFFNDTPKGVTAKKIVAHGDVDALSIWANQLVEKAGRVMHGMIREVSLVLAGANPEARIENISIRHSDDNVVELDDEAIIFTGEIIRHADGEGDDEEQTTDEGGDDETTVEDVYEAMTEEQKTVVHYMVGEALASSKTLQQDSVGSDAENDTEGNSTDMNVFEKQKDETGGSPGKKVLSHSELNAIVADATASKTSLKDAFAAYALAHGITNVEVLFPEATAVTTTPQWITRRMGWVSTVLDRARKTPFARIKSWTADLTFEEARARGYVKGNMKRDQYFAVSKRTTTPQTVYKRQKMDRDDIVDITDFDVVAWVKGEMRVMLDEELARAILIGDGRELDDQDKIFEDKIRPIVSDDPFYTYTFAVPLDETDASVLLAIDSVVLNREFYRGTGTPDFYTTEHFIARCMTLRDNMGHRLYRTLADLAAEMRVDSIIPVEVLNAHPEIVGVLVSMGDYTIGADRGGQVTMFDDFDIDFNQYKWLLETRISGALTRPMSAQVVRVAGPGDVAVTPEPPTQNRNTGVVTVPESEEVLYFNQDGNDVTGTSINLEPGENIRITAQPAPGFFFTATNVQWTFLRPPG